MGKAQYLDYPDEGSKVWVAPLGIRGNIWVHIYHRTRVLQIKGQCSTCKISQNSGLLTRIPYHFLTLSIGCHIRAFFGGVNLSDKMKCANTLCLVWDIPGPCIVRQYE